MLIAICYLCFSTHPDDNGTANNHILQTPDVVQDIGNWDRMYVIIDEREEGTCCEAYKASYEIPTIAG